MKTYLDSLSLHVMLVVTSNFTLGHVKISYYSMQKKIQHKKRSTAWWPIGLVRTAFKRIQKNRHPSER